MIFVMDDDRIMASCIANAIDRSTRVFTNGISAMEEIANGRIPDMIFLDILLDGPDGFTFLNELVSYGDTAKIPVVVVTSLDLGKKDLSMYGIVGVLDKDTMKPKDIRKYVKQYAK